MDFTKLLKHCEAQHSIKIDTSAFSQYVCDAIWQYMSDKHGETLLLTEQWDILETLQESPKPGNPPPIIAEMKGRAFQNIKRGESMKNASWYSQEGVLLSNADALKIVEFCERVNVEEQLPDFGTGFRPDWSQIDAKYVACAADENGKIFFYPVIPKPTGGNFWFYTGLRHLEYPYTAVNAPVENWRECLWIRPEYQQQ